MPKISLVASITVLAVLLAPAALAAGDSVTPGLWQTTVTVTDVGGADMPPEVVAMMTGKPRTYSHCVTPEEAAKGPREMLKQGGSCTFSRFSMAGGRLDAAMSCPESQMTATTSGTYSATGYTATSHMVMAGADGMQMTANVVGKRVGGCK